MFDVKVQLAIEFDGSLLFTGTKLCTTIIFLDGRKGGIEIIGADDKRQWHVKVE